MPKRTKSSANRAVLALMLIGALGVGGFAAYVKLDPAARHIPPQYERPAAEAPAEEVEVPRPKPPAPKGPDVSVTRSSADTLRLPSVADAANIKLGELAPPVPDGTDPKVFIATATLGALKVDKARAIGITVKDRNALIDFSPELQKGYGSTEEATLVKAMATALGQFPDIDTFQFVVDGKVLDTLGQIDLSEPIPVVRPDGKEAVPAGPPSNPGSSTQ